MLESPVPLEEIRSIALVLVEEVGVALVLEHREIVGVEHLVGVVLAGRELLVGLPLCALLPESGSLADLIAETAAEA